MALIASRPTDLDEAAYPGQVQPAGSPCPITFGQVGAGPEFTGLDHLGRRHRLGVLGHDLPGTECFLEEAHFTNPAVEKRAFGVVSAYP